jgi:hypothetical protein
MIWFICKQCGKRHSRPDEAGGSLVFCECGQANRVPWESTAPLPPEPEAADSEKDHDEERDRPPVVRPRRRPVAPPRDPSRCLNHEDAPAQGTCAACGEAFCASCVVELQGETLCGPCKNYRLGQLQRSPQLSPLALVALLLGLLSAPVGFCLTIIPLGMPQALSAGTLGCGLIGLILPAVALVLGLLALRDIEADPRVGGRALALTGTMAGALGVLWCLTVVLLMAGKLILE